MMKKLLVKIARLTRRSMFTHCVSPMDFTASLCHKVSSQIETIITRCRSAAEASDIDTNSNKAKKDCVSNRAGMRSMESVL
jgi:hypothetical protein